MDQNNKNPGQNSEDNKLWNEMLDHLKNIPETSSEWDNIDKFIDKLQDLRNEKMKSRSSEQQSLDESVLSLRSRSGKYIEFFELVAIQNWDSVRLLPQEIAPAQSALNELTSALQEYAGVDEESATTYRERLEKRSKLEALEERIHRSYELANNIFLLNPIEEASTEQSINGETAEITKEDIDKLEPSVSEVITGMGEEGITESEENFPALLEEFDHQETNIAAPTTFAVQKEKLAPVVNHAISRPIALGILSDHISASNWEQLVYALICDNDIVAAYWIAYALEQANMFLPTPSWLLAAMEGSQWLSSESDSIVIDLLEISQNIPASDQITVMLSLSAALRPAVIAPYSGLIGWLQNECNIPPVQKLVEAIKNFASIGVPVDVEIMDKLYGEEKSKNSIKEIVQAAKEWMDDAPHRRAKIKRASDVWRYLTSSTSEIMRMMALVASDERESSNTVEELCIKWREQDFIFSQIDEIDSTVFKVKSRPIVGAPRSQIFREIQEACRLAWQWARMAQAESEKQDNATWINDRLSELRSRIISLAPACLVEIQELRTPTQPLKSQAAGRALTRSIIGLLNTMRIPIPNMIETEPKSDFLLQKSSGLKPSLNSRLLYMPDLDLDNDGAPKTKDLALANAICSSVAADMNIQEIRENWIKKKDFRFLENLSIMETDNVLPDYQEAVMQAQADLAEQKGLTQNAVEQGLIDGIISDEKRSELTHRIEAIFPEQSLNQQQYFMEIEAIRNELAEARNARLDELKKDWERLQPQLAAYTSITEDGKLAISNLIQNSFLRSDCRLVDEYLARLSVGVENKTLQDEDWGQSSIQPDSADTFFKISAQLHSWLDKINLEQAASDVREGLSRGGINFRNAPSPRRAEAARAIDAWRQLKKNRSRIQDDAREPIGQILSYLGFVLDSNSINPISIEKTGDDWLYAAALMTALENSRPIPQFGSQAKGKYHIVCLWERPGAGTIHARLLDLRLSTENVIVFYFGRITEKQRQDLIRHNSSQELSIAILDDMLLFFLATESDVRLPAFLKCSLPLSAINPYTPFKAGDVPPEMFFGREDHVNELLRSDGSCIVYGGRQLGKSALLRQVNNKFNDKQRNKYAKVEDIKLLGTDSHNMSTKVIWKKIRECFKEFGLIPNNTKTDVPEEISQAVKNCMVHNPQVQVMILFDEADNFLEADSKNAFTMTDMFRALMTDTGRRFKVVFAGLHNVQRFQDLPNQPLAHFGKPILVGPLDPSSATSLIQNPLFFLGYRFQDENGPLRILSYTNYHPGLIQLFCQELLNRMRKRPGRKFPFHISQADLEAIYQQLKDQIRERFDWTLALDPAYQAIAWSLAENQMASRDGYSQAYDPQEILGIVRYWWQGFPNDLQLIRGLLKELVGLGVLVKDQAGKFRLRSPNLVRLMGTENEIGEQLLQLVERKQYLSVSDNTVLHAPFDDQATEYSPLTFSQEGSLYFQSNGVGLIFASKPSGLYRLPEAIRIFSGFDESSSVIEIPLYISDGDNLRQFLDRELGRQKDKTYISAYHQLTASNIQEIHELIVSGIDYCSFLKRKNQYLRLYFILDTKSTNLWFTLPADKRIAIENEVSALAFPQQWSRIGITERLKQKNKMDNPAVVDLIMKSTGGWHVLIEQLFTKGEKIDDLKSIAKTMIQDLENKSSEISTSFAQSLELDDQLSLRILLFIKEHTNSEVNDGSNASTTLEIEYISPDFINEKSISQAQCDDRVESLVRLGYIHLEGDKVKLDPIVAKVM